MTGALGFCLGQFPIQFMDALPYLALLAFVQESRQAMLLDERLVYAFSGVKPEQMVMREYNNRRHDTM